MKNIETNGELAQKVARLEKRVLELEQRSDSAEKESRFLKEILDTIPVMVTAFKLDSTMMFANRAFAIDAGLPSEDIVGMKFTEFLPPQDFEAFAKYYMEVIDKPDGTSFTSTMHGLSKEGKLVFINGTSIKKMAPPICGFVGCATNVTEQVTVEATYKESVEAMLTVFNKVQDGLLIHDKSGSFIQANRKILDMFGVSLDDLVAGVPPLTADNLYGPEGDSVDLRLAWEEVLAGANRQLEYRIRRKSDGMAFDVEVFMSPIRLKGNDNILVVIRDVTEKKRSADELLRTLALAEKLRKRAEAASETKSRFLAGMSHELRTPLTAILGYSELLELQHAGKISEKQASYIKVILSSGQHLLQLINDILDIAKVEAGKLVMQPSAVDLNQMLNNSITMIKEKAFKEGIKLEIEIAEPFNDELIWTDEVRIKQVMMNLLSNAVKFTPSGGTIKLQANLIDEAIQIRVSDTGIGIKPEDQSRIFEEFEQIDSSFARKHQGTGLGLALSKQLVELHGGRIWVQSDGENHGSVFGFEIPYVKAAQTQDASISESDVFRYGSQSKIEPCDDNRPIILVVEDNLANMKLTTNLLELLGYRPFQAFSAAEAMDILEKQTPALILMDISLPGIDGLTATRSIKSNPATAKIPIVALTAHAMKDDETRALDAGCEAYLLKPIDTRIFFRTISEIIKRETAQS